MDNYDYWADLDSLDDELLCDIDCHCTVCIAANRPDEFANLFDSEEEDHPIDDINYEAEDHSSAASESDPVDPQAGTESIQRMHTCNLKARLAGQDIPTKVLNILSAIRHKGMDLLLFLDVLFWGEPSCHAPT